MKKLFRVARLSRLVVLFVFALPHLAGGPAVSADQRGDVAAVVVNFSGDFSVKAQGAEKFALAKKGQFLYEGDVVKTGVNSLAAVTFVTGIQVKINENTEIAINAKELGQANESITMNEGQVYSKVLRRGSDFGVRTAVAVATVRGTEFDVNVKPPVKVKKKIKIRVKKSKILEKGLAEIIRAYEEAYKKEAKERLALRDAELKAKLEKQSAQEAEKKAEEARKKSLKAGEGQRDELARKADEAKELAEEMGKRVEDAEMKRKGQAELYKQAQLEARRAEEAKKRAEKEEKRKAEEVVEERDIESIVQEQLVSVLEGRVELVNDFGRVDVNAGQRAMVSEGEAPQPPQEMRPDEKPVWQEKVKIDQKDQEDVNKKLVESGVALPLDPPKEKILRMEVESPSGKKTLLFKFKRGK